MPNTNSQADFIRHAESLRDAVERCLPEEKQALERDNQELGEALGEVKAFKARQEELVALRQEVTQKLTAAVKRGKEASLSLRAVAKAVLGPRNERLVHFNVSPVRARRSVNVTKRRGGAPGTKPGAAVPPGTEPVA